MNIRPTHTSAWLRRTWHAFGVALALAVSACGGGDGGDQSGVGGVVTPQIDVSPGDRQAIVGQFTTFFVEAQGANLGFGWEEQPAGSTDWRAAAGMTRSDTPFTSSLIVGPVDIGMDQRRFRGRVSNAAGSVASAEAVLGVVWGTTATLEPNSIDFGPGAGGFGSGDGGSPGGGDGEGAGVGGGLGKTLRAPVSVARVADGASLGSAPTGATSGLVRVKAGPGAAPVVIALRGDAAATYYDEGRDAILALPAEQELHALVLAFDRHLGVTTLTEAGYRYALNNFLQDPAAVRAGLLPLKRSATTQELAGLTTAQIQLANEAVRSEINRLLPPRYALESISTLPTPVDNTSPAGSITDNIYGRMQAVVGGLALAAARFEPALANPALTMNAQLADDLTDGVIDGVSLDGRSVFGAPGTNAYGPDSLAQFLADAADAQFQRFGDGTIPQPPAITAQPTGAVITEGGTATLSVTASGSQSNFQWFRDGIAIPGAVRAELSTSLGGEYYVEIRNAAGTVTSNRVTVTVVAATVAPAIASQPAPSTVTSGDVATFTVAATGTDLRFQWQLVSGTSASDIPGANAATYSTGTAGTYRVVVSNSAGSVTSQDVTLTVTPRVVAPQITRQPTPQAVTAGQAATLQVEASGSPLAFQWYDAGGPIPNATAASFTTTTTGTYYVAVSNSAGTVESDRVAVTVVTSPVIINTQPASVTINAGQSATLTVVASGSGLTYQWLRDGTPITGANQASFVTGAAGSYAVVVTNSAGSVTSATATVTVVPPPVINTQPASATINEGQDHTFSVVATGSDLRYQWFVDGDAGGVAIAGATQATFTTRTAGRYVVEVANGAGSVRSTAATLTVIGAPSITRQPASITIAQGATTTLSVEASGQSLTYQWRLNGNPIAGATGTSHVTGTAGSWTVVVSNPAGSATSDAATVSVVGVPSITTHPASATINQGATTTLTVAASGSSLTYQWLLNGSPIATATAASYTTGVAGTYTVVVSNLAGSVTSNPATITVIVPPAITTQPASVTINQGQTTTLSVVASGTSPAYQWLLNGNPIAGATAASYATGTAGSYTVVVSNAAGSVTSSAATVTVIGLPSITTQPASETINQGATTTLTVVASGSSLTYQWRLNGTPIAGATAASYTTGIAGTYTVVVSNPAGSVTSNPATITVIVPPTITTHPASVTINFGQTTTLTVVATGTSPTYQWLLNGAAITGAGNVASLTTGTPGSYAVVVTNAAGSVTSNSAIVTVIDVPSITQQPVSATINPGQTATFFVVASGQNLAYQWQVEGSGGVFQSITGATSAALITGTAGRYRVVVSNSAGSTISNVVTLNVNSAPAIVTQPASVVIAAGSTTTLSVAATGTAPLTYEWFLQNNPIANSNAATYVTGTAGNYFVRVTNSAGTAQSTTATVTVVPLPTIVQQPQSAALPFGYSAQFTVVATNATAYQWHRGTPGSSTAIAGATSASYTTDVAGSYFVVVSNQGVTSVASNVVTLVYPPEIATQPQSIAVNPGASGTFTVVVATGSPVVPSYQWYRRVPGAAELIAGATGASFTTSVAGTYFVVVSNPAGSVTSQDAGLSVIGAPVITLEPQDVSTYDFATLTVAASGANVSYEWFWVLSEGSPYPVGTGPSLFVEGSCGGVSQFFAVATNSLGSAQSRTATVEFLCPTLATKGGARRASGSSR